MFDRFVQYRHAVAGLSRYGEEAMRLHPPAAGARVLDVGCGFGNMMMLTVSLQDLVDGGVASGAAAERSRRRS